MPKRNETLKFSTAFQGTARASAQTTIVDTSYPMRYTSRYSTAANGSNTITSIDEGRDVYFVIETDNVPNGAVVRVILNATGMGTNQATVADFTDFQYDRNVTINNGFGSAKITIAADQLTEGKEYFYCAALDSNGTVLTHAYLDINDTSKTPAPTYTMGWYSSSAGTTPITSINEGSTAWLIVRTTNVPNGTVLSIRPDMRVSQDDFTDDALNREAVIQNNIARVSYPIKADNMFEGDETFTVQAYTSDDYYNAKAWAIITVIDTSFLKSSIQQNELGVPSNADAGLYVPNISKVAFVGISNNGALYSSSALKRTGTSGTIWTYSVVGEILVGTRTNRANKMTAYSWDPATLTTALSRKSLGKYMGSLRYNAPYGEWIDRDYITVVTLAQLQDSLSKSTWGEITSFNSDDAVLMWFGENWNYAIPGPDQAHGIKFLNIQNTSVTCTKPQTASRNGYVSVMLLKAFDDPDVNGADAPYPRIIKAGKLPETTGVRIIKRKYANQDYSDESKYTLVLSNNDYGLNYITVNRYIDRFEIINSSTRKNTDYCAWNYFIVQNHE